MECSVQIKILVPFVFFSVPDSFGLKGLATKVCVLLQSRNRAHFMRPLDKHLFHVK